MCNKSGVVCECEQTMNGGILVVLVKIAVL
jgi:hypothetical protein